ISGVINNLAYVGLGYNDTTYMTDFYQYNPSNDTWATVASIGGVPRYSGFAFTIGSDGYSGTGSYAGTSAPISNATFWRFSDCGGSGLSIQENPGQGNSVSISVTNDE